jgi:hypothetical protein
MPRRRYRFVLGLCAVLALGAPAACDGNAGRSPEPGAAPATTWQRLPDLPLSARLNPVLAWTGREVLVVGGDPGAPCPIGADCARANPYRADGAAFDPVARQWRRIADAPAGVPDLAPHAYVAGHLFVSTRAALLDYDVRADRWRRLRLLPEPDRYLLAAAGDSLLLHSGSDEDGVRPDYTYDVLNHRLARLPDDPLGPTYDRTIVATPAGLVLTAVRLSPNPTGHDPLRAALLDQRTGTWRRLPAGRSMVGSTWWSGHRVVNVGLEEAGADHGSVRWRPVGSSLDLATLQWEPLPEPPGGLGGWSLDAAGDGLLVVGRWLYDHDGAWSRLPVPDDAPDQAGPAVWADELLLVVGGLQSRDRPGTPGDLSTRVWGWQLPALQ